MEQMQMNMPDIYDAALYLRLSKDDKEEGGAKSESNSIANQRELLRSFVKSQPDIQIFEKSAVLLSNWSVTEIKRTFKAG